MELVYSAPVTLALIAANLVASFYAFADHRFMEDNTFFVGPIRRGQVVRMVTSGFIHVNMLHVALNLYVLFIFGPYVENQLGSLNYAIMYGASLLGGSLWALLDNWRHLHYRAVGASGAISGVIAAFCMFYPMEQLLLFFIIPMPALLALVLLLVGSAYFSTRPNTIIGHEAHFGGALTGAVVTVIMAPWAWGNFTNAIASFFPS